MAALTPEQQAKAVELYRSGLPTVRIAERFGCCRRTVLDAIKAAGITPDATRQPYDGCGSGSRRTSHKPTGIKSY